MNIFSAYLEVNQRKKLQEKKQLDFRTAYVSFIWKIKH